MKRLFVLVVLLWSGSVLAVGQRFTPGNIGSWTSYVSPQDVCAMGAGYGSQFTRWMASTGPYGKCCIQSGATCGSNIGAVQYGCASTTFPMIGANGGQEITNCVSACPSGYTYWDNPNFSTTNMGVCIPSCSGTQEYPNTNGDWSCTAPPCTAGTAFVGVGADTQPKCLSGCSYAISAPAVYGEVTAGVVGVHSRWVASGATCTDADGLVAADVTGCPDEVSPDMRAAICGIPAPCEAGEFLFSGECVADSAETGCVIVDGEQVCAEAEQNCVVINGKRVCAEVPEGPEDLETYKENGCVWSFAQAAWVCPTDTATKTTTGTTTTETDPVTGNKTTTTVTTIRNNVTGGTTTVTTTVVTDPDGNEISRDVSEATTGTGGEGGTLAARDPTALGERADLDWLKTEEEVMQTWADRWEAAPIVAAVSSFSNLSLSSIEGTCPEFCLPLWGETLCTTKHCEIWETVSFIISGVLLALYGMTAMRIVLSA